MALEFGGTKYCIAISKLRSCVLREKQRPDRRVLRQQATHRFHGGRETRDPSVAQWQNYTRENREALSASPPLDGVLPPAISAVRALAAAPTTGAESAAADLGARHGPDMLNCWWSAINSLMAAFGQRQSGASGVHACVSWQRGAWFFRRTRGGPLL